MNTEEISLLLSPVMKQFKDRGITLACVVANGNTRDAQVHTNSDEMDSVQKLFAHAARVLPSLPTADVDEEGKVTCARGAVQQTFRAAAEICGAASLGFVVVIVRPEDGKTAVGGNLGTPEQVSRLADWVARRVKDPTMPMEAPGPFTLATEFDSQSRMPGPN